MTLKSPKNIFALAFLALLVYLNFENDPHASTDEAMFAMEMNDGSGGLRGNGNSQAPLFELTGRRSLSQEEINEVAKFTGWVEEKSAEFDKEQRHRVSFYIVDVCVFVFLVAIVVIYMPNTHPSQFSLCDM